MEPYVKKSDIVAEINRVLNSYDPNEITSGRYALVRLRDFLDTLEVKKVDLDDDVDNILEANDWNYDKIDFYDFAKHFFELGLNFQTKDMIEALRTEYEKGRADVIADTLSWLANVWPKYCSNQTIIEGFKEAIKD